VRTIPYYVTREVLLHPEIGKTLLEPGSVPDPAFLCAELARLVYKKFERSPDARAEIIEALQRCGYEAVLFSNHGASFVDSQAMVVHHAGNREAIVVFRGTEMKLDDLSTDLAAWLEPWVGGGRVHAGFAKAFNVIWPEIRMHLDQLSASRVTFTGHSLGAALATLAANLWKDGQLVTFGSPRVGDGAFVASFGPFEQTRYVDCCDLVCSIPYEWLEYRHLSLPRYIDREGVVHTRADEAYMELDRNAARSEYVLHYPFNAENVPFRELADHAPLNYVAALRAAAE